jgi:hypothetical protein
LATEEIRWPVGSGGPESAGNLADETGNGLCPETFEDKPGLVSGDISVVVSVVSDGVSFTSDSVGGLGSVGGVGLRCAEIGESIFPDKTGGSETILSKPDFRQRRLGVSVIKRFTAIIYEYLY